MRAANAHSKLLKLLGLGAAAALLALAPTAASAGTFKVLYSFCAEQSCHDGYAPTAPLVMDSAGNLYGTASKGGAAEVGTAFELKRTAKGHYRFKKIMDFGHNPNNGGLIIDTAGNLYGYSGNDFFKLSFGLHKHKWQITVLSVRCSQQNCGTSPVGRLTYAGQSSGAPYDGSSPLYGVMEGGGSNNAGLAYELTPNGGSNWTETVLYNFCSIGGSACTDGAFPFGAVVLDGLGNLYGTATFGGNASGAGVVYRLSQQAGEWVETILYDFCSQKGCSDGDYPVGNLAFDSAGNIVGSTNSGGKNNCPQGCGVIFELSPIGSDWEEFVLHAFCTKSDCADGARPQGAPMVSADGTLFGTTEYGGANDIDMSGQGGGVVYSFAANNYRIVHRFCALPNCADGEYPNGALIQDSSDALVGTAPFGGTNGNAPEGGTAFLIRP